MFSRPDMSADNVNLVLKETLSFTKIIIKIIEIEIKSEKITLIRNKWICAKISTEFYGKKL